MSDADLHAELLAAVDDLLLEAPGDAVELEAELWAIVQQHRAPATVRPGAQKEDR